MARLIQKNPITGAVIFDIPVETDLDGYDLATEILSNNLIEFDEITFIDKAEARVYTIRHFDGSYAPVEVLIEK